MISVRFLAFLSTLLLVVGALLVGEAIHGGVVTRSHPVTSPWVVLRLGLGAVFIALGYRFKTPHEAYVSMPSDDHSEPADDPSEADDSTSEFDSEMSPLGEDGLEHVDADRDE